MKIKTLLSVKKKKKWIHYNLINQTMIETSLSPRKLNKLPMEIREELLYATDKEFLVELNRTYFNKVLEELKKKRDINSPFLPQSEVTITLWYDCNFACPYCYQQHDYYEKDRKAEQINVEKVIDFFKTKSKKGAFPPKTVVFIGGEPLLKGQKYKKTLLKLLKFLNNYFPGIQVHIISNGYFLEEYIVPLSQFDSLNYVLTITLGSTRKNHEYERILKNNNPTNTFEKIFKGLQKFQTAIPSSYINIRMNFGKDYKEVEDTKKLMIFIKERLTRVRFELTAISTLSNHLEWSSDFFKLIRDLLKDKTFSKSIFYKIPDKLYLLIKNSIKKLEQKEISSKQAVCNAVTFVAHYDLFSDFQIQPCENFRFYNVLNSKNLIIQNSILQTISNKAKQCFNCPFFIYCISSPCRILKRVTIKKKNCNAQELLPFYQIIKKFY